jgi:hypothetical protein
MIQYVELAMKVISVRDSWVEMQLSSLQQIEDIQMLAVYIRNCKYNSYFIICIKTHFSAR